MKKVLKSESGALKVCLLFHTQVHSCCLFSPSFLFFLFLFSLSLFPIQTRSKLKFQYKDWKCKDGGSSSLASRARASARAGYECRWQPLRSLFLTHSPLGEILFVFLPLPLTTVSWFVFRAAMFPALGNKSWLGTTNHYKPSRLPQPLLLLEVGR